MENEDAKKSIERYAEAQEKIIDTIRAHGGKLTRYEFDEEFSNFYNKDGKMCRREPFVPRWEPFCSFLGDINGGGDWSKWLDLTQRMALAGIIDIVGKGKEISYELI